MYKLGLQKEMKQRSNCQHSLDHRKSMGIPKNFCFINYTETFDCVDQNNLWKILKVMGIPDHLTCLLRNLYACQEAAVRTRHGTMDWFQTGKGVCQDCILSPCSFNLYVEWKVKFLSHVRLLATTWIVAYQALSPWNFPGKSTGVGCHFLLQGIFPTQGSNLVSCIPGRHFTIWATREVHHAKCQAGWGTSWNQDCREKYQ